MSDNGRKARYGAAYVRSLCSQAGLGFDETTVDEDILAVDGTVQLPQAGLRVQIKCSSRYTIGSRGTITLPIEERWRIRWAENVLPLYLVTVVVPDDLTELIDHSGTGTFHAAAAYWQRIDPTKDKIVVPKKQRLTAQTFSTWEGDLRAAVGGGSIR